MKLPDPEQQASCNPRSLDFQLACLRDVRTAARSEEIDAGLEGLEATVIWLQQWADLIKMLVALKKSRPDLFQLMVAISSEFPGATIEDIRNAA